MFDFNGFTQKQAEILKQPRHKLNIYTGAVRSGKTVLTYFDIPELIKEFPKGRGILLGKTLGTIEENILKPMRDIYGDYVGDIKSDASGNRYVTIFGAKIRCVGANDKSSDGKIRGATYSWAVCDEVSLYPENVFDMLMSRLSEPNAKCICTTNPDNPQHWFKVRFIDNTKIDCAVYNFTIEVYLSYAALLAATYSFIARRVSVNSCSEMKSISSVSSSIHSNSMSSS